MLMLDYPPRSGSCSDIMGQWKAFEEFYTAKRVRTIAVSNFSPAQLRCILADTSATPPAVNQMLYSVGHGASPVIEDNEGLGINVQAYTPLGSGSLSSNTLCRRVG